MLEYRNSIQYFPAYRKHVSVTMTDTISEKKFGKQFSKQMFPRKKAGVAILIKNKVNFQPKVIKRDKEGHLILVKGKILPR